MKENIKTLYNALDKIKELEKENKTLKQQIEIMKCCGNCEFKNKHCSHDCHNHSMWKFTNCINCINYNSEKGYCNRFERYSYEEWECIRTYKYWESAE